MNLSKEQLLQIIREETSNELEEGALEKLAGAAGKLVKGASNIEKHPKPTRDIQTGPRSHLTSLAGGQAEPPARSSTYTRYLDPRDVATGPAPDDGSDGRRTTTWDKMRDKIDVWNYGGDPREGISSRLRQMVREETLNELEEGRFSDAFSRAKETIGSLGKAALEKGKEAVGIPTHTGGRVTRGGSQGQRARDSRTMALGGRRPGRLGVPLGEPDEGGAGSRLIANLRAAEETPAEAEAALAAETPYGPEHSIYTATRAARGEGRVTAGGSGGARAKAAERLGIDPSQDPVDVDPRIFPAGADEYPGDPRAGTPGAPMKRFRRQDLQPGFELGDADDDFRAEFGLDEHQAESLTRLRLRQMVMEELQVNEEEKWIQGAEEDIEKRGTEGVCTGEKFGGPTCRAGTKRYNLAKTFRKMAKKRKKKE